MQRFFLCLTAWALAMPALAQPAPRPLGGSVELGYVSSAGNSELTSFSLGEKLVWRAAPRVTVDQSLRSIRATVRDSTTVNSFAVGASADYRLFDGVGVTAGGRFERDRFAGIRRRVEETIGLVWRFSTAAADSLRFDAGAVWTQQRNLADEPNNFVAARTGLWYKRPIGAAYVQQILEAMPNLEESDDWRVNSETAIVAPISRFFGLKVAYVVKYDNLPEPTFRKTDRVLTASLQASY